MLWCYPVQEEEGQVVDRLVQNPETRLWHSWNILLRMYFFQGLIPFDSNALFKFPG